MPIHANRIVFGEDPDDANDYFAFEDMRGRLQPKTEQLEVIVRPGHRGETTRRTGIRAVPSQVLTLHYVFNWETAIDALIAYVDLIGYDPVRVYQHSAYFGYWKVLGVAEVSALACQSAVGQLIPGAEVLHAVQWTLLSTDPPE